MKRRRGRGNGKERVKLQGRGIGQKGRERKVAHMSATTVKLLGNKKENI